LPVEQRGHKLAKRILSSLSARDEALPNILVLEFETITIVATAATV
jgi:hypothetical protein